MKEYHHSQPTRFTVEEARERVGKRAKLTLEGTIIAVRDYPAGACVIFEPDERFGFEAHLGMDLELLEVEP